MFDAAGIIFVRLTVFAPNMTLDAISQNRYKCRNLWMYICLSDARWLRRGEIPCLTSRTGAQCSPFWFHIHHFPFHGSTWGQCAYFVVAAYDSQLEEQSSSRCKQNIRQNSYSTQQR